MTSFDTIIIGAGHNGLAAAGFLAKSGCKVVVLEASDHIGGGARTVEFANGYRTSGLAHLVNRLDSDVIAGLGLDRTLFEGRPVDSIALDPGRGPAILRGAYGETLEGVSAEEAGKFAAMRDKLMFQASILGRFLRRRPPRPGDLGLSDIASLSMTGLKLLRRGREEARDFGRMLLMNVADIVEEYLSDDRLAGLVSFDATLGIHLGPRSPTSLLGLYYRLTGETHGKTGAQYLPKGGMGSVTEALMQAMGRHGVTVRASTRVSQILIDRDKVLGVITASGEIIRAPVIVAAIHPVLALQSLLPPGQVDTGLSRSLHHLRSRGDAAKLHLALDKVPSFIGLKPDDHVHRMVIAPSMRHVENAFNPAKYGEFSPNPVMEITLPSLADPALAPPGGCTLSAIVQYAPYGLKEGWEAGKPKFMAAIMATLEAHAPGISTSVKAVELLVPPDIETRFNMPGGHWHHGELQVDQLLINRPAFAISNYETPVAGLYLASAGTHPGGGISGRPGLNAANHILARSK